ncbi:pirin family protein [Rhodobium gokarnense]|uniref:Redox-sensitive bicupin YhaK (Pirin superfamily) n=1 Tax=Rhodobium gokarnense TaxID=364296 RepID=A0ABT3HHY4_9HYPH|nr:pirin family protein [Rhodobium gokarnense]MCW2310020.1 redox-sensitive bicupin YhaK (pirin superfamily) [Rhodobium gokarnense]
MSADNPAIDTVIAARTRDLGGFEVARVLPSARRRMVGPFIFLDQMGPAEFLTGTGIDVRPHPHIGLSTLTYLYSGALMHRDSEGHAQVIRPGEVNWMTAGRGIAHSERSPEEARAKTHDLFGLQFWVALPKDREETDPSFIHYSNDEVATVVGNGIDVTVVAGTLWGATSEVETVADLVFADIALDPGAAVPVDADHEERAVYVLSGRIDLAGSTFSAGELAVLAPGHATILKAEEESRVALLGGPTADGPRHIWWNFVSSSKERIEDAKADWKAGRFPLVAGDETEFVPLPEQ